jgi:glycosyltransferase involved in cell wall biosynthesis
MSDLTVFVSTFNRIQTLARCLYFLEGQEREKRIVIVDNGSDHPDAVNLLRRLSTQYIVYWMPRIEDVKEEAGDDEAHGGVSMQAVQRNVSEAFRWEWERDPSVRWYGMTDADVHLDGEEDSLDTYIHLAAQTGRAVGPHLRLNTHVNYPLRAAAIIQHARILFREDMQWWEDVPWSPDPIDTTFHLFKAGPVFNRLGMDTARVGPPWCATHSDWMINLLEPTPENHAYILGSGEAASWGGRWLRPFFEAWLQSPEEAYELVSGSVKLHDDYFYPWFMWSWMLQYGHACQQDLERSRHVLRNAIPDWSPCHKFEPYWDAMVYDNDFSCLGWTTVTA